LYTKIDAGEEVNEQESSNEETSDIDF